MATKLLDVPNEDVGVATAPPAGDLFAISPTNSTWTFADFNRQHCVTLVTPVLGIERFGSNNTFKKAIEMTEAGTAYAAGVAVDLGIDEVRAEAAVDRIEKTINSIEEIVLGNGKQQLTFQAYLSQHPNFGISNTYAEEGTLTKILHKTLGLGVNIARLMGNFNPNYQVAFNFPQIWQDSKFQEIQFQSQINAFTLDAFKGVYTPTIEYNDTTRGSGVMQVALIALMMAAPRVAISEDASFVRRLIKSPPVVDLIINKMAFRSCFIKEVTIEFGPKHEDGEGIYSDSLGFPMEAKINWNVMIPVAQTQEDLFKTFNQIGTVNNIENSRDQRANFSSYTLNSTDFLGGS